MNQQNPFNSRYGYSPRHRLVHETDRQWEESNTLANFSGGDLTAFYNHVRIGNLENISWNISVEAVGNYVMGRRDPVTFTTGKRVIVGSMVFSQYGGHAILEEIHRMSDNTVRPSVIGDLWSPDSSVGGSLVDAYVTQKLTSINPPKSVSQTSSVQIPNNTAVAGATPLVAGLSPAEYVNRLREQLSIAGALRAAEKLNYSDQLPMFDLTLVGVNKSGQSSFCVVFGIQMTQETGAFSQSDMTNAMAFSFTALSVQPWRPVTLDTGGRSVTLPALS